MVVVGNGVMDWEVSVVVLCVQFWLDVLNDICFTFHADHVLNGLALIVLLPSGSKEVVRSLEPIENRNLALSGAHEEHVLSKAVLHYDGLGFLFLKNVQQYLVALLARQEEWRTAQEVRLHAKFWLMPIDFFNDTNMFLKTGHVQSCVAMKCIFGTEINGVFKFRK